MVRKGFEGMPRVGHARQRGGIVGSQKDIVDGVEINYPGGGHQYEFINDWRYNNPSEYLDILSQTLIQN